MRIFFVCEGNSCRSVMAEHLFKLMLKKREIDDIQVFSRGLDVRYFTTTHHTAKVMKDLYGIDVSKHVPRELSKEEGQTADLILTMNKDQKERTIRYGWGSTDNTFSLSEYLGTAEMNDIVDPYGGSIEQYRETANRIEYCLTMLLDKLFDK